MQRGPEAPVANVLEASRMLGLFCGDCAESLPLVYHSEIIQGDQQLTMGGTTNMISFPTESSPNNS